MTLLKKLLQLIAVLLVVTFATSSMIRFLPGDPVLNIVGLQEPDSPEAIQARADLGLDRSIIGQYQLWLGDAVRGDLGTSYIAKKPATTILWDKLPITMLLLLYAQILALVIAIPIGVLSAYKADSRLDRLSGAAMFGLLAVPVYLAGVALKLIFSEQLNWFPPIEIVPFGESVFNHFKTMTLPTVTLALGLIPIYARVLRTDMIATLKEDFIDVARAKGLPPSRILFRHALRPSSFSLLTVSGIVIGNLIGGSLIVEFLFRIDGMGSLLIDSIQRSDYILLQAGVTVIAVAFVTINFSVDMLYSYLDPRIRRAHVD